jgi:hypothetical protein
LRIFLSYSQADKPAVDKITSRLKAEGHDIWIDSMKLRPGDNLQRKIQEGIEAADAVVVVISTNSFRSKWVQHEVSAIALQQISKGERRVIPVRIDWSDVPSYLADRVYVDLSENFNAGLDRLAEALRAETPASLSIPKARSHSIAEGRAIQLEKLGDALRKGRLMVCGAGVSIEAGIPTWGALLVRLLETMMKRLSKDHSLNLSPEAAAEFQRRHGASALILGKYLKNNLGRDFLREMRNALYAFSPVTSPVVESVVRLARPQRDARPLDSVITFNFDCLLEENLTANSIANRPIFSEAIKHGSNELPIYHVHGYLPRTGPIPDNMELVKTLITTSSLTRLAGQTLSNLISSRTIHAYSSVLV